MYQLGFLCENDKNEYEYVKSKFRIIRKEDEYHLMILPTYQCNLRCWYCTQRHAEAWITPELIDAIKLHLTKKLQNEKIVHLTLSWFGGEPLMAYDKVLHVTTFAQNLCEKLHKNFNCNITTNGTLLSKSRIEELGKAGVRCYQITIDGTKDLHDKTKKLNEDSAYERAINNINMLPGHSSCVLRFNYTKANLKPKEIIAELNEHLTQEAKQNIEFSIQKVWQQNEEEIDTDMVDLMYKLAKESGLNPIPPNIGMCYADKPDFNCIFPNGKIGKCDNDGMNSVPAHIKLNGDVFWPENLQYTISPVFLKDSECYGCKYLPQCWGPCPSRRKDMLRQGHRIICFLKDKDKTMNEHILRKTTM